MVLVHVSKIIEILDVTTELQTLSSVHKCRYMHNRKQTVYLVFEERNATKKKDFKGKAVD